MRPVYPIRNVRKHDSELQTILRARSEYIREHLKLIIDRISYLNYNKSDDNIIIQYNREEGVKWLTIINTPEHI